MSDFDRVGFLEHSLARHLDWIAAADSRASFVFAADTAMLGVLAAVSPKIGSGWAVAPAIFATFAAVFGLATLLFLSFASFPRTKGPKNSLIYFGGVSQRDADQFRDAISDLTLDSYIADLSAQCHRNAEIAARKFTWVQRAMIALYLSVAPWVVAILILHRA